MIFDFIFDYMRMRMSKYILSIYLVLIRLLLIAMKAMTKIPEKNIFCLLLIYKLILFLLASYLFI